MSGLPGAQRGSAWGAAEERLRVTTAYSLFAVAVRLAGNTSRASRQHSAAPCGMRRRPRIQSLPWSRLLQDVLGGSGE